MYGNDHNPPHFHALYNEYHALVEIETGKILAGSLPSKQLKHVKEWADINKEELLENFKNLRDVIQTYKKIKPII